jgi:hypothetical protein
LASSRRRFASSARRSSSDWVCLNRRRSVMVPTLVLTGPNPVWFALPISILKCRRTAICSLVNTSQIWPL